MAAMFDPLHWLASKGAVASLDKAGEVQLLFDQYMPRPMRERIRRVVTPYMALLKLQLDVPPGTRPGWVPYVDGPGE